IFVVLWVLSISGDGAILNHSLPSEITSYIRQKFKEACVPRLPSVATYDEFTNCLTGSGRFIPSTCFLQLLQLSSPTPTYLLRSSNDRHRTQKFPAFSFGMLFTAWPWGFLSIHCFPS